MTTTGTSSITIHYEWGGCTHPLMFELYAQRDGEWTDEVVGLGCADCGLQEWYP